MKNFKLDGNGDVVIKNGEIEMVSGVDLTAQTFRQVIATNLGEWGYNPEEGMDFSTLLKKHYDKDFIQETIEAAIKQVDENAEIIDFSCDVKERKAEISFFIVTENEKIYIQL